MTDETNTTTTAPAPAAAEPVNPAPAPEVVAAAAAVTIAPAAIAAVAAIDPEPYQGDSGDETDATGPAPAPKTHFDYHELPADMRAAVDHARGFFAKLEDVFQRVEHEAVDEARKAMAWAKSRFEDVCHRIER